MITFFFEHVIKSVELEWLRVVTDIVVPKRRWNEGENLENK